MESQQINIFILGDSKVGKTRLIFQYLKQYSPSSFIDKGFSRFQKKVSVSQGKTRKTLIKAYITTMITSKN